MAEKKVLILSEAFGAGHTKTAQAIKEGILLYRPQWNIEVIELGVWMRPRLTKWITELYIKMLRYSPKLWGVIYRKARNHLLTERVETALRRFFYTQVTQLIHQYQPDLIVCTHPFPSAVISCLKRRGLQIPLYTVVTDYGAHGSWVSSQVDYYFVPSPSIKKQFVQWGVSMESVRVADLPTHPKFWVKKDQQEVRSVLGLKNMPTLLIAGGGLGIGFSKAFIKTILHYHEQLQILWVTGKNQSLYDKILEEPAFHHPHIRIYGFVDNMDELMDASDFMMTKPGGVTCAEAMGKGLPVILINPIPGQEEDNMQYMLNHHQSVLLKKLDEIQRFFDQWVHNPSVLRKNHVDPKAHPHRSDEVIKEIIEKWPILSKYERSIDCLMVK